eukprot:TRINITY_DN1376_c0_g5_i1.p2 TRINITY_DN1376_c0_g5~~TRINITY_DN1376_c0_g5_i1.p2  ORF type:complete len:100 (-),score=19.27 TRINITY_DN1376_c0_g5_i1:246-545(-)
MWVQDLLHELFKLVWEETAKEVEEAEGGQGEETTGAAESSKKKRNTTANAHALRLSCELLRLLVAEAVGRAALVAEAEGQTCIEGSHLERILPQLLLDF